MEQGLVVRLTNLADIVHDVARLISDVNKLGGLVYVLEWMPEEGAATLELEPPEDPDAAARCRALLVHASRAG